MHALLWQAPLTAADVARDTGLDPREVKAVLDAEHTSGFVAVWGEEEGRPVYTSRRFGDEFGEFAVMTRGDYSARFHVAVAFLIEIFLFYKIAFVALTVGAFAPGKNAPSTVVLITLASLLFGVVGAYLVFRQRWRCVESFSSRYCSGVLNLSATYVPIIALFYANLRGVKKLFGR